MGLLRWMRLRKTYESVKEINIKTIWNYLKALYNKWFNSRPHILEQVEYRKQRIAIKSPECLKKGECFCGCDINDILYQPEGCMEKNRCFPRLKTKKEWEKFKNQKDDRSKTSDI